MSGGEAKLEALLSDADGMRAYHYARRVRPLGAYNDAMAWLTDEDARVRAVGPEVLGAVALDNPWAREPLLTAASVGATDTEAVVRAAAANTLSDLGDEPRSVPLLIALLHDPVVAVRVSAIASLGIAVHEPAAHDPAVPTLMALLRDPEPVVRDWAVTALGGMGLDTVELRDELVRLLDDGDGIESWYGEVATPGEAAVALARLGDPRLLEPLLARLADPEVGNLWVEAAGELADARLLPALRRLQQGGWAERDSRPHLLAEAVTNCWPTRS